MEYISALQMFIVTVLFDKGEFNFKNKNFKPIKVMVIFVLIANVWFSAYLLNSIHRIQKRVEKDCPTILLQDIVDKDESDKKKE